MSARPQAVTLALHGALLDRDSGVAAALAPWAERHGVEADVGPLVAAFHRHEPRRLRENPELRYPDVLELVFADLARDFGVTPTGAEAAAFGESVGDWPLFAESAEALGALQRHVHVALVANIDRATFTSVAGRLGGQPDVLVTAEDAGAYKPERAPFEMALDWLSEIGVGFDAVLHTGEARDADIAPARAMGLRTCRIDRADEGAGEADWRVGSLNELVAAIRQM
ncbi:putative hydrolase of the HAD superfamily [Limimonas halophila]|uniref:Putative hydrolase of the HAD superfamily n=1 Tax=Limimonas halophila TaxID=1082479 RepID=A0A1G7TJ79_9PROT|nr:hypothetical protein [Limimonas halophila]SDG34590.1 putative hydrolase of the HAD superfamily [Limimonas halophila]